MTDQQGGATSNEPSESATGSLGLDTAGTSTPPTAAVELDKPELPWAFIDCSTDILVILIAHMLDLLCQHNDQVVLTPDALTRFHSRAPPNITVVDYLRRIVKYTNLEKIPLLSLLAYIDLTCQNLPTFTLSSLTVHRFLIAGVTAGSKAQCDVFCTNSHYAKVGGIKVNELNSLEREFLRVTGWALCCNADLLQRYYTSLIRSQGGYQQAVEPTVSPFLAFPDAGKPAPNPDDSAPATPVDATAETTVQEEEAMASGSEYASDDEEENGDVNGTGTAATTAAVVPDQTGMMERGRSRGTTMEVDSPVVDTAAALHPPPETDSAPQRGASTDSNSNGSGNNGNGKTLKQFVGGIFRRHDTATPEKRLKSRPLGETASTASATVTASNSTHTTPPSAEGTSSDMPKPLTPRVRTRDERSVDSIRSSVPAALVGADDSKRRARVE